MKIEKIDKKSIYFIELINYARTCSWSAGVHLADLLENDSFIDWESAFAAIIDEHIVGFCTFMKTDYYPNNKYDALPIYGLALFLWTRIIEVNASVNI